MAVTNDIETRLRVIIRNAEPNEGMEFPHWMGNGWFIIVRKSKVKLYHSHNYDSRTGRLIDEGPRNTLTYSNFATAMGL